MSAQTATQTPATKSAAQAGQRNDLARRSSGLPLVPSLMLDPLGFFDDNPFSLLRRMQREINRAFPQSGSNSDTALSAWAPPVEVSYNDGNLIISAELPGLSENDVKVEVNNDVLSIEGERKVEEEKTEGGVHLTERRYGRFYRAIALPDGADVQNAKADFQNGVLRITVPVQQTQQNQHQIPIQAAGSSQHVSPKSTTTSSSSSEKAA
jgi:HSP20 family protein